MRNLGTISAQPITLGGGLRSGQPIRLSDSAISSGQVALVSELEKRDPILRQPLTSVTYPRDIPISTGGGWVDTLSTMHVQYGVSGGSDDSLVAASGANESKIIQANLSDEKWGAHVFDITMRVGYIDMQRQKITGRNLDTIYNDGIRLAYDKHQETNGYLGIKRLNTFGLLNYPDVPVRTVAAGSSGQTSLLNKTADECLDTINKAITTVWNQAENSLEALPNHILLPYEQYSYIATQKVSQAGEKTILTFILENNISKINGGDLFIGATNFCKGVGVGTTDRMVVYVNNEKYLKMEELVSLHRSITQPNVEKKSYDTLFLANISELEMFYTETIGYFDGI